MFFVNRPFTLRLFLLVILLAWEGLSFSSGQDPVSDPVLQYRKADAAYRQALALASQENYSEAAEEKLNQQALQGFRKLVSVLHKEKRIHDSLLFFGNYRTAELEHFFDNSDTALHYYQRSIALKGRVKLEDSLFFKPYLYAALIWNSKSEFDSALVYLKAADRIQLRYRQKLEEAERLYNNMGTLHYETGNYVQALNYFEKAVAVLQPANPIYEVLLVNYRSNIAAIYIKLQEYSAARKIYEQLLTSGLHTEQILHNLALSFLQSGNAQKALQLFRQFNHSNRLEVGRANDMGRTFLQLQQKDSARRYLQQALDLHRNYPGATTSTDHALTFTYLGDLLVQEGRLEQALQHYQNAILNLFPSYKNQSIHDNPKQFSGLLSYLHLFQALTAKANAWEQLHAQKKNIAALEEALETYTAALDLADHVAAIYDNDEARLFLSQARYVIHSKPVAASLRLYALTGKKEHAYQSYLFDQRGKAAALAYRQQELQSSDEDQDEEEILKTKIARLSIRAGRSADSLQLISLQEEIRDAEIQLGRLQEGKGKVATPAGNQIPDVRWLQRRLLNRHTAILSYNLSDTVLTCFTITSQHFNARQVAMPASTQQLLQKAAHSMQGFTSTDPTVLKALYRLLIPDSLQQVKRWIVIPDGLLHYLPFEALMDEANRYLVIRQSVQYQYSTALLQEQDFSFSRATTLGMAPFVKNRYAEQGALLPHSLQELKPVKGKTVAGPSATRKEFLQSYRNYPILHLATHASINEQQPHLSHIAFSPLPDHPEPTALYLNEIGNLPMQQTKLVVLSACATAGGKLLQGEGVMSISRAFAFAGCPNMVTTLWKADDASTAYIVQRMHLYLQQNKTLDVALQQAKIDYLQDKSISPRMKSPAYWAHLVFIGDFQPEQTDEVIWWIAGISSLAFIVLACIQFRKKQKRRK